MVTVMVLNVSVDEVELCTVKGGSDIAVGDNLQTSWMQLQFVCYKLYKFL
jgi:hypothetical protein